MFRLAEIVGLGLEDIDLENDLYPHSSLHCQKIEETNQSKDIATGRICPTSNGAGIQRVRRRVAIPKAPTASTPML